MALTVIDYEAGNLRSVETALRRLGARFSITSDAEAVRGADRIILPGVGDAAAAMNRLRSAGLESAIDYAVGNGVPFLGICLGSQIVLTRSEENDAVCLDLIPGTAVRFGARAERKVPHMGWNDIRVERDHPIFYDIPVEAAFYFVHSYFPVPDDLTMVLATTDYGESFPSVIGAANIVATQFHPEKSGEFGLRMLSNFLAWNGGD